MLLATYSKMIHVYKCNTCVKYENKFHLRSSLHYTKDEIIIQKMELFGGISFSFKAVIWLIRKL